MKSNHKAEHALRAIASRVYGTASVAPPIVDVVGLDEMMRRSGLTRGTLYVYSTREDFPAPVARKGKTLFWQRHDFEGWLNRKQATTRGQRYETNAS